MVCFARRAGLVHGNAMSTRLKKRGMVRRVRGRGHPPASSKKKKKKKKVVSLPSPGTTAPSSGASPGTGGWLVSQSIDKAGRRLVGDGQTLVPHKGCGRGGAVVLGSVWTLAGTADDCMSEMWSWPLSELAPGRPPFLVMQNRRWRIGSAGRGH